MSAYTESRSIYCVPTEDGVLNNNGEKTSEQYVLEAVRNEHTFNFTRKVLLDSYRSFFPTHADEVDEMVKSAFSLMETMARSGIMRNDKLRVAFNTIHKDIMQSHAWFPDEYKEYRNGRARNDIGQVLEFIKGSKKVLDFGCGASYLGQILLNHVDEVHSTDVEKYGTRKVKTLNFKKMNSPTDIQYPDNYFDAVFANHVFHHIDPENLPIVIDRLSSIGKRMIVKEDILLDSTQDLGRIKHLKQNDLNQFVQLGEVTQREILITIDYFANVIGQGILNMNMPFQFKKIDNWLQVFSKGGWEVAQVIVKGMDAEKLHKSPQAVIIVDSIKRKS